MPKRTFEEFRDLPRPSKPQNALSHHQHDRINAILDQNRTAVARALKIARGIERQKLGRRQKTAAAQNQLDDTRRLKLEVLELKALDLGKTAEQFLCRSLLKVKAIAESDGLPERVHKVAQENKINGSVSGEGLNVLSRLLHAEVVQAALGDAVEAVGGMLGFRKEDVGGKRRLRAKDYAVGQQGAKVGVQAVGKEGVRDDARTEAEAEGEEEGEEECEGFDSEMSEDDDGPPLLEDGRDEDFDSGEGEEYERYAARLASDSGSDSASLQSDFEPPRQDISRSNLPTTNTRLSLSLSPSPPPPSHRHNSARSSKPPPATTTDSIFLPTLQTTAGYYSGSDASAPSDDDNNAPPQRKNRMGQQARRALWEKKYKSNAKHLQLHPKPGTGTKEDGGRSRDSGWDSRKGAVAGDERGGEGKGKGGRAKNRRGRRADQHGGNGRNGKTGSITGANLDPVSDVRSLKSHHDKSATLNGNGNGSGVKKPTKGDAPLHPSWEAAKRAKEAKSVARPMGKKVIF